MNKIIFTNSLYYHGFLYQITYDFFFKNKLLFNILVYFFLKKKFCEKYVRKNHINLFLPVNCDFNFSHFIFINFFKHKNYFNFNNKIMFKYYLIYKLLFFNYNFNHNTNYNFYKLFFLANINYNSIEFYFIFNHLIKDSFYLYRFNSNQFISNSFMDKNQLIYNNFSDKRNLVKNKLFSKILLFKLPYNMVKHQQYFNINHVFYYYLLNKFTKIKKFDLSLITSRVYFLNTVITPANIFIFKKNIFSKNKKSLFFNFTINCNFLLNLLNFNKIGLIVNKKFVPDESTYYILDVSFKNKPIYTSNVILNTINNVAIDKNTIMFKNKIFKNKINFYYYMHNRIISGMSYFNNFNVYSNKIIKYNNIKNQFFIKYIFRNLLFMNDIYQNGFNIQSYNLYNNYRLLSSKFLSNFINMLSFEDFDEDLNHSFKNVKEKPHFMVYNNHYPVFQLNENYKFFILAKFQKNRTPNFLKFMQFSIINFFELFLNKNFLFRMSSNYYKNTINQQYLDRIYEKYSFYQPKIKKNFFISEFLEII